MAGQGVNVNAIAPGYISTDNTEALRADETRSQGILSRIPASRWGEPEDFKGPVAFLSSPASSYIHGTNHLDCRRGLDGAVLAARLEETAMVRFVPGSYCCTQGQTALARHDQRIFSVHNSLKKASLNKVGRVFLG